MPGNIRGQIDCKYDAAGLNDWKIIQEQYVSLYKFLKYAETQGICEMIASYFGDSVVTTGYSDPASVGDGMDYWNNANAAGQGAFAVFRWKRSGEGGTATARTHSYYILIQWVRGGDQGGTGFGPAAPWGQTASDSFNNSGPYSALGIQSAIGDDGAGTDENPWNGTTLGDGTDTKGTPVWAATAVAVFPRGNGVGGLYATNKEGMALIGCSVDNAPITTRANYYADDDHLVLMQERSGTGFWAPTIIGPYTVNDGITVAIPHVMVMTGFFNPTRMSRGDYAYGASTGPGYQGGVTSHNFSLGPTAVYVNSATYDEAMTAAHQPTVQGGGSKLSAFPFTIFTYEVGYVNGLLGEIKTPLLRQTNYVTTSDQNAGFTRIILGYSNTFAEVKNVCPWDGTTPVGSVLTRDGVQFSAAP